MVIVSFLSRIFLNVECCGSAVYFICLNAVFCSQEFIYWLSMKKKSFLFSLILFIEGEGVKYVGFDVDVELSGVLLT